MPDLAQIMRKNRKEREALRAIDYVRDWVDNPHDFGGVAADATSGAIVMPSPMRLAISHSSALNANDVTVNVLGTRSFSHPALSADIVHRGIWAEEGFSISISRGSSVAAGTFTLYVVDFYGRHIPIATATFA